MCDRCQLYSAKKNCLAMSSSLALYPGVVILFEPSRRVLMSYQMANFIIQIFLICTSEALFKIKIRIAALLCLLSPYIFTTTPSIQINETEKIVFLFQCV